MVEQAASGKEEKKVMLGAMGFGVEVKKDMEGLGMKGRSCIQGSLCLPCTARG